jgi:hypothetical protein
MQKYANASNDPLMTRPSCLHSVHVGPSSADGRLARERSPTVRSCLSSSARRVLERGEAARPGARFSFVGRLARRRDWPRRHLVFCCQSMRFDFDPDPPQRRLKLRRSVLQVRIRLSTPFGPPLRNRRFRLRIGRLSAHSGIHPEFPSRIESSRTPWGRVQSSGHRPLRRPARGGLS